MTTQTPLTTIEGGSYTATLTPEQCFLIARACWVLSEGAREADFNLLTALSGQFHAAAVAALAQNYLLGPHARLVNRCASAGRVE